jgi:hypothetical protein
MSTYFELDPCLCKQNRWRMGIRARDGKTEFHCFDCGAVTYVRLTKEAFDHLAGGD